MTHREQTGDLVNYELPVWEPLVDAVGEDLAGWFMWMHEVRLQDGTASHAYKHRATRRYLHVDETGTSYAYLEDRYRPEPLVRGLGRAFAEWYALGASAEDLQAVDLAIERAAERERTAGARAGGRRAA